MPEKKHRNPFEEHINSEAFDVSRLGSFQQRLMMDAEMKAFFEQLPEDLNHDLWDTELDERQRAICAYLTTELAERILRENYPELLADISDDDLVYVLTVPVALAMLAEARLNRKEAEVVVETAYATQHPLNANTEAMIAPDQNWGVVLNNWFLQAKDFVISLFRRS